MAMLRVGGVRARTDFSAPPVSALRLIVRLRLGENVGAEHGQAEPGRAGGDAASVVFIPAGLPRAERKRMDLDTAPTYSLSTERVLEVLRAQQEPLRRICLTLLAGTGMRSGDLKGIRVGWWGPAERLITIPKQRAERNKKHAREIPLGPYVAGQIDDLVALHKLTDPEALLFAQPNGRPLTTHPNNRLRPWGHRPHDLRRWFLSTLMDLGCPPPRPATTSPATRGPSATPRRRDSLRRRTRDTGC